MVGVHRNFIVDVSRSVAWSRAVCLPRSSQAAAQHSNNVLEALGSDIEWLESYVVSDKTFCVYMAKDEAIVRAHAEQSGFGATNISEVKSMIGPATAKT